MCTDVINHGSGDWYLLGDAPARRRSGASRATSAAAIRPGTGPRALESVEGLLESVSFIDERPQLAHTRVDLGADVVKQLSHNDERYGRPHRKRQGVA
jgi:hypothetical protein